LLSVTRSFYTSDMKYRKVSSDSSFTLGIRDLRFTRFNIHTWHRGAGRSTFRFRVEFLSAARWYACLAGNSRFVPRFQLLDYHRPRLRPGFGVSTHVFLCKLSRLVCKQSVLVCRPASWRYSKLEQRCFSCSIIHPYCRHWSRIRGGTHFFQPFFCSCFVWLRPLFYSERLLDGRNVHYFIFGPNRGAISVLTCTAGHPSRFLIYF